MDRAPLPRADLFAVKADLWRQAVVVFSISIGVLADATDGFALNGFPVRRIFQLVGLVLALIAIFGWRTRLSIRDAKSSHFRPVVASRLGWALLGYSVFVTGWAIIDHWSSLNADQLVFVAKRLIHWSLVLCFFWIARQLSSKECNLLVRLAFSCAVAIAVIVSVVAVADYVAVNAGVHLFERTAIGTGYGEIDTRFLYYGHYRALGTFREPSLLAAYLVPCFFLALGVRSVVSAAAILAACMLSLSLLGGLAILLTLAFVGALFASEISRDLALRFLLSVAIAATLSLWLMNSCSSSYGLGYSDGSGYSDGRGSSSGGEYLAHRATLAAEPLKLLRSVPRCFDRAEDPSEYPAPAIVCARRQIKLAFENLPGRGYVFQYVFERPLPLFGEGLGIASFQLGEDIGSSRPASFLSFVLYAYAVFGVFGLSMISIMFYRFVRSCGCDVNRSDVGVIDPVAAFASFVAVAAVLCLIIEEPSVQTGLIAGLVAGYIGRKRGLVEDLRELRR